MGGPPVRAAGLVRVFGGVSVLAGVDLTVEAGEAVALLGPNGAGKTTLLRVLALLVRANAGHLELFGIDGRTADPALRRRIGYVGHESSCYADLSAAENLGFYARVFGVAEPRRRVGELLAWAGLEHAASRPVRTYSRGMAQRLALARAFLHEPDLLLLDEPWSGLDPQAAEALVTRLAALRHAGAAIVLTTHDVERAASVVTRTAILHRGRIVWAEAGGADTAALAAAYRRVVSGRS